MLNSTQSATVEHFNNFVLLTQFLSSSHFQMGLYTYCFSCLYLHCLVGYQLGEFISFSITLKIFCWIYANLICICSGTSDEVNDVEFSFPCHESSCLVSHRALHTEPCTEVYLRLHSYTKRPQHFHRSAWSSHGRKTVSDGEKT